MAFILTPATFPDAILGVAYNQSVVISGGVAPYTVVNLLPLPFGLNYAFDGVDTIAISGTPTGSGSTVLSFDITDSDVIPVNEIVSSNIIVLTTAVANDLVVGQPQTGQQHQINSNGRGYVEFEFIVSKVNNAGTGGAFIEEMEVTTDGDMSVTNSVVNPYIWVFPATTAWLDASDANDSIILPTGLGTTGITIHKFDTTAGNVVYVKNYPNFFMPGVGTNRNVNILDTPTYYLVNFDVVATDSAAIIVGVGMENAFVDSDGTVGHFTGIILASEPIYDNKRVQIRANYSDGSIGDVTINNVSVIRLKLDTSASPKFPCGIYEISNGFPFAWLFKSVSAGIISLEPTDKYLPEAPTQVLNSIDWTNGLFTLTASCGQHISKDIIYNFYADSLNKLFKIIGFKLSLLDDTSYTDTYFSLKYYTNTTRTCKTFDNNDES